MCSKIPDTYQSVDTLTDKQQYKVLAEFCLSLVLPLWVHRVLLYETQMKVTVDRIREE